MTIYSLSERLDMLKNLKMTTNIRRDALGIVALYVLTMILIVTSTIMMITVNPFYFVLTWIGIVLAGQNLVATAAIANKEGYEQAIKT